MTTEAPVTTAASATCAYSSSSETLNGALRPHHLLLVWALGAVPLSATAQDVGARDWSGSELRLLATLSLGALAPVEPDWRNPLAGNASAEALGALLFRDARLSGDGSMACATCHLPQRAFQDGLGTSRGRAPLTRNAPSLVGSAHRAWLYWDGRKDSLWAQALEPMERADEMAGTRSGIARLLLTDARLRERYEGVFGAVTVTGWRDWPARASPLGNDAERAAWRRLDQEQQRAITRIFVDAGVAIAAFEATLALRPTRFDRFVEALRGGDHALADSLLDGREQRGLRRFISGDTGCVTCHLGPRFTTDKFHNIGTGRGAHGTSDPGRLRGRELVAADEFNCRGPWSPAAAPCRHLDGLDRVEVAYLLDGAFRTPTLRDLVHTAPYMHDGRHATLEDVMRHYVEPPDKKIFRHELPALMNVSERDAADLVAFLKTLSSESPVPAPAAP